MHMLCLQVLAAPSHGQQDFSWRRVMRVPPRPYGDNNISAAVNAAVNYQDHHLYPRHHHSDHHHYPRQEEDDVSPVGHDEVVDGGPSCSLKAPFCHNTPSASAETGGGGSQQWTGPQPQAGPPSATPHQPQACPPSATPPALLQLLQYEEEDSDQFVGSLMGDLRGSQGSFASARDSGRGSSRFSAGFMGE